MIEVVNLNKSFGEIDVLHDINIKINKGEKVVVVGPSGSGKSTFLRCLNCMEDPTSGSIIFNGVDIADMKVDINIHRQKMGMVFQHFNLSVFVDNEEIIKYQAYNFECGIVSVCVCRIKVIYLICKIHIDISTQVVLVFCATRKNGDHHK